MYSFFQGQILVCEEFFGVEGRGWKLWGKIILALIGEREISVAKTLFLQKYQCMFIKNNFSITFFI